MCSGDHGPQEEERGGHLRRGLPPLQGLHRLGGRRRPRQGLRVGGLERTGHTLTVFRSVQATEHTHKHTHSSCLTDGCHGDHAAGHRPTAQLSRDIILRLWRDDTKEAPPLRGLKGTIPQVLLGILPLTSTIKKSAAFTGGTDVLTLRDSSLFKVLKLSFSKRTQV